MGSLLCGSKDFIKRARRWRKVLGGGMRQAGLVAAAGIYALENNISRLQEDHDNAAYLAHGLSQMDEILILPNSLHTNMFFIREPTDYSNLHEYLKKKGIVFPKIHAKKGMVRLVTHLDISRQDIDRVVAEMKGFYQKG